MTGARKFPAGISVREAVAKWGDHWAAGYFPVAADGPRFADIDDGIVMDFCSVAIEEDGRRESMNDRARVGL